MMAGTSDITSLTESKGKEIVLQTETTYLAALKPTDLNKVLYVKVYRKWTLTNKASVPTMYCCILLDQQGGAIQVNIKPPEKDRFNMLEINKAYTVTNYGFQDASSYMQTVPHTLSLAFGRYTEIKEAEDNGFPAHYFNFVPYSELYLQVDKKERLLTDYIGLVQYVSEVKQSVKPTKEITYWRDIGIQNLDGLAVRFTLWNERARNFNIKEYEEADKPTTIAVSSCTVKTYGGLQLSNTPATFYYFNPDIQESNEIRSVYNDFFEQPTILNVQHQRCANIEDEKNRNRVTLADLLAENPNHQKNVRFTVVATIESINNRMPWYYARCLTCKGKVSARFPHAMCKPPGSERYLDYCYCFKAFISDNTGRVMLTCFSNEAHSIVPSCNDVADKLEDKDPYKVPPELLALEGRTYIFQLHYGPDSTKDERFFIFDKAWDPTPLVIAPPEEQITQAAAGPSVELKLPSTPVEETTAFPQKEKTEDETKTTTARRPLFQSGKTNPEAPVAKRTKKQD